MNTFQIKIALLLSAMLACSAGAHAELALTDETAAAWTSTDFQALIESSAQADPASAVPVRALAVAAGRSSAMATAVGTTSPALADIGLWRFISSVRAQQTGTSLVLLESNLRILEISAAPSATTVPLPGAAWCLVMGMLGLVGVKTTGRKAGLAADASDNRKASEGVRPVPV